MGVSIQNVRTFGGEKIKILRGIRWFLAEVLKYLSTLVLRIHRARLKRPREHVGLSQEQKEKPPELPPTPGDAVGCPNESHRSRKSAVRGCNH